MDELAFKQTYHTHNHQRCVYEKLILLRYGGCEQAEKILLAEREGMACSNKEAQKNCQYLLNISRQKARFSLQLTKANAPLPHSQELRVQVGSLFGLQQFLQHQDTTQTESLNDDLLKFDPQENQPILNIFASIKEGLQTFNQIDSFPFTEMVKAIMHFKIPSRKRKKKKK